jgi:hypothetical protein
MVCDNLPVAIVTAPPVIEAGQAAVYRDGNWQIVADHRGETVYSVSPRWSATICQLPSR